MFELARVFHPEARLDLVQASEYYRAIDPKLKEDFMALFEAESLAILENPELFPVIHPFGARRNIMKRFSYQLVYILEPDAIYFIAICHMSRRPDYWAHRLLEPGRE